MSELINSVEPTTHQTAKKRNWAGILGLVGAVAALIILVCMRFEVGVPNPSKYTTDMDRLIYAQIATTYMQIYLGAFFAACGGSLILSIIGLFAKPQKIAVAGLITALATVLLFFILGVTT
ncbi:MAG: hypothetical protein LBT48_00780 [Prevotellaceae bacterium]|jgi:hypothetical protein|nr:hypothetical protein [Prevotellaceae bacterium]